MRVEEQWQQQREEKHPQRKGMYISENILSMFIVFYFILIRHCLSACHNMLINPLNAFLVFPLSLCHTAILLYALKKVKVNKQIVYNKMQNYSLT